jgi:tripartite-type tricarboxylate transporter receptor subunit TctC
MVGEAIPDVYRFAQDHWRFGGEGVRSTRHRWLALLAPAGTDKAIVEKLYAAAREAVNDAKLRVLFAGQGAEAADLDPEGLRKFMASEIAKWSEVIGKLGIAPM